MVHWMKLKIAALATVLFGLLAMSCLSPLYAEQSKGRFLGAMETEFPSWFKESFLDLQEDIDEATASNKRVMLFFQQAGCPYCNALVERNLSQKDIEQKVRKNIDVIAINMWGDREVTHVDGRQYTEKTLAEALRVQFTPTLIFFNRDSEVILRLNGYRSPQRFALDLDYVIQGKETEISYRDFIAARQPAKKISKALIAEEFFTPPPYDLRAGKDKPLAVFFEQKDCPNCVFLHEKVLVEAELRAMIGQFNSVQLDMWSQTPLITPQGKHTTARQWASDLDIKYAPSIVLFDRHRKEVIRTEAFFKVFHNMGVFNYVLSKAYEDQPSFQRYLSDYAEQLREQGRDVDIWRVSGELPGQQ